MLSRSKHRRVVEFSRRGRVRLASPKVKIITIHSPARRDLYDVMTFRDWLCVSINTAGCEVNFNEALDKCSMGKEQKWLTVLIGIYTVQ